MILLKVKLSINIYDGVKMMSMISQWYFVQVIGQPGAKGLVMIWVLG